MSRYFYPGPCLSCLKDIEEMRLNYIKVTVKVKEEMRLFDMAMSLPEYDILSITSIQPVADVDVLYSR